MTPSWADDPLVRDLWDEAERPRRSALSEDGQRCVYHGRWLSRAEGEAKQCGWCLREREEG